MLSLAVLATLATALAAPLSPRAGYCTGINQAGLDLLKEFEGFVAAPAPDPIGLPTVGYGHLCKQPGCSEITGRYSFPLTEATAVALLGEDIPNYSSCVAQHAGNIKLNENEWAALTSFVFNLGCGSLAESGVMTRINNGENRAAVVSEVFPQYVHAGGQVLPGLVRRRNAEIALFKVPATRESFPGCT